MCELFGLSSSRPIAGREVPLAEFRRHGGATADNPDGWGVAWREAGHPDGFRLDKEPAPGSASVRFAALIDTVRADLLIAHVRKARIPPTNTLANTHPFTHECCGRKWAFAHNGMVPDIVALETDSRARVCRPEGETDSEFAFCHLLGHMTRQHDAHAGDTVRLAMLGNIGEAIARHGKFNFLLSDGHYLAAYGHDRLHALERYSGPEHLVLIATEPLTGDADWRQFEPGELRIYRAGRRVERIVTHPPAPSDNTEPSLA